MCATGAGAVTVGRVPFGGAERDQAPVASLQDKEQLL